MSEWLAGAGAPVGVEFQGLVKKFPMDRTVYDYPKDGWWEPRCYISPGMGELYTYDDEDGWETDYDVILTHWQPLPTAPSQP